MSDECLLLINRIRVGDTEKTQEQDGKNGKACHRGGIQRVDNVVEPRSSMRGAEVSSQVDTHCDMHVTMGVNR